MILFALSSCEGDNSVASMCMLHSQICLQSRACISVTEALGGRCVTFVPIVLYLCRHLARGVLICSLQVTDKPLQQIICTAQANC